MAPTEADYANGTAADVLDWEDCTWTGHASAGAVPAAFAYGEQKHASGKEVITAIVAAYEVYQRIAMAVQPEFDSYLAQGRGWGLVNWQVFASAVAAGKLLGLDALQMAACISLAAYQAPTLMGKDGDGDIYHYAHGIARRSGAESAEITRQGFEYYYDGLEGDTGYWLYVSNRCEWDWLDKELGKTFYINETLFEALAGKRVWVQAPLDGLHNICTREKLGLSDIEKVRVSPIIDITSAESPLPMGLIQAEYSLPHCFACYLTGKKPLGGLVQPAKPFQRRAVRALQNCGILRPAGEPPAYVRDLLAGHLPRNHGGGGVQGWARVPRDVALPEGAPPQ